jgi:general secretion pathway protein C
VTPRDQRLAADIFTGAVIVSVAIALAGLTWRLAAGIGKPASPAPLAMMPNPQTDITPIVALAPFGNGASGAPIPTTMPFELKGVLMAVPSNLSSALIAPSGGGASISYRIGQPLPGGGTIETIGLDNVIFAVSGHREILTFPKPGQGPAASTGGAASPPAAMTIGPNGSLVPAQQSTAVLPPIPSAPASGFSPQAMLDSLAAQPTDDGYRVGSGLAPTVRAAGLQPGDVVQRVNGAKLGNPATDQQLLAAAMRTGTIRLDVMRGGQQITLAFPAR